MRPATICVTKLGYNYFFVIKYFFQNVIKFKNTFKRSRTNVMGKQNVWVPLSGCLGHYC